MRFLRSGGGDKHSALLYRVNEDIRLFGEIKPETLRLMQKHEHDQDLQFDSEFMHMDKVPTQ